MRAFPCGLAVHVCVCAHVCGPSLAPCWSRPVRTAACWPALTLHAACLPGSLSVSQCSKEDGRSSSGPPHETAASKRTYDMMEGRVGRALTAASIEGGRAAHAAAHAGRQAAQGWVPMAERMCLSAPPGGRAWDGQPSFTGGKTEVLAGPRRWGTCSLGSGHRPHHHEDGRQWPQGPNAGREAAQGWLGTPVTTLPPAARRSHGPRHPAGATQPPPPQRAAAPHPRLHHARYRPRRHPRRSRRGGERAGRPQGRGRSPRGQVPGQVCSTPARVGTQSPGVSHSVKRARCPLPLLAGHCYPAPLWPALT